MIEVCVLIHLLPGCAPNQLRMEHLEPYWGPQGVYFRDVSVLVQRHTLCSLNTCQHR